MKKTLLILFLFVIYQYTQGQKLNIHADYVGALIENNIDYNQEYINEHEIYNKIISYESKFKLDNKWQYVQKIYDDGTSTALNNSKITKFYIYYILKNNKKVDGDSINIPKLDSIPYNKLNDIIKSCNLEISNHKLIRSLCFNLMDCLLYEDYFNMKFLYGNMHDIVNDIKIENQTLFYNFTNADGKIRKNLEYKQSISLVRIIEKYINYQ